MKSLLKEQPGKQDDESSAGDNVNPRHFVPSGLFA